MENENKKVTIRTAPNFGYQLAGNLGTRLEQDSVPPSRWPLKFPITFRQVIKLPEIDKNDKVARKVVQAAQAMWKDMRETAVEVEKDMKLHPEYYEAIGANQDVRVEPTVWRQLSIELEQIAGNIFVTEFDDEDAAKENIYSLLNAKSLKKCIVEFEDDYTNFLHETREAIRARKEILPSIRFEMICLLNVNNQAAQKSLSRKKSI